MALVRPILKKRPDLNRYTYPNASSTVVPASLRFANATGVQSLRTSWYSGRVSQKAPSPERHALVRLRCPRNFRKDMGLRDHRLRTTTSLIRRPDRRSVDAPGRRCGGPRRWSLRPPSRLRLDPSSFITTSAAASA